MSTIAIPQSTTKGWMLEMPREFAQSLGVDEGSFALFHARNGELTVEVLPPPSQELIDEVDETWDELREAFEEMKRRGD